VSARGGHAPAPELRLHGLHAVQAAFARRPEALRKLYLAEARIPALQPLLEWCVAHRIGYRVVGEEDLRRLAASAHHEGVVADMLREEPVPLTAWLRDLPPGPCCALWLDGVGNPHNLGAMLRSAAHFGAAAVLLPKTSTLALSGAAARVAEGGAEAVRFVRMGRPDNALAQLRGAGFALAATVVRGGADLFATPLPRRPASATNAVPRRTRDAVLRTCGTRRPRAGMPTPRVGVPAPPRRGNRARYDERIFAPVRGAGGPWRASCRSGLRPARRGR